MSERDDLEYMLKATREGDYARVVERGAAVLASGADPSSIIMLYADALEELGRTSEAESSFRRALAIDPDYELALEALASLEDDRDPLTHS